MAGTASITVEVTVEQVAKLHLVEGDILIVRVPEGTSREGLDATLHRLVRVVREVTGDERFPILLVIGDMTLEQIPETQVRELGWARPGEGGQG